MSKRTLVKVYAGENCIGFRTISRNRKSRQRYLVTREQLARLEYEPQIITQDIYSFAVLRRDSDAGTLSINFSLLSGHGDSDLSGWEETVTLPYDAMMNFVQASTQEGAPEKWSALSIEKVTTPQIVFVDKDRLHKCLENKVVRKNLRGPSGTTSGAMSALNFITILLPTPLCSKRFDLAGHLSLAA